MTINERETMINRTIDEQERQYLDGERQAQAIEDGIGDEEMEGEWDDTLNPSVSDYNGDEEDEDEDEPAPIQPPPVQPPVDAPITSKEAAEATTEAQASADHKETEIQAESQERREKQPKIEKALKTPEMVRFGVGVDR